MLKNTKLRAVGTLSALSKIKCHQTSRSTPCFTQHSGNITKTPKNKLSHNDFIKIFPWKL